MKQEQSSAPLVKKYFTLLKKLWSLYFYFGKFLEL